MTCTKHSTSRREATKETLKPSSITGVSRPENAAATSNASSIDNWVPLSSETLWPLRTDGALRATNASRQSNALMSSLVATEQSPPNRRGQAVDTTGWEGSSEHGETLLEEPSKTSSWAQWMKKWRKK